MSHLLRDIVLRDLCNSSASYRRVPSDNNMDFSLNRLVSGIPQLEQSRHVLENSQNGANILIDKVHKLWKLRDTNSRENSM